MAQQRIRQSRLPEILAQFGRTGPGEAIREGLAGFKEGASLAATIAARKRDDELKKLQIQNIEQKLKSSKDRLAAQEKLAKVQAEPKTQVGQEAKIAAEPRSSLIPESTPEAIALTGQTGELEADPIAPRQQATLGLGETSKIVDVAPTRPVQGIQPTGETLADTIPAQAAEALESNDEDTQNFFAQAYPDLFGQLKAKELFPKKLTDLERREKEAGIGLKEAQASFFKRKPTTPQAKPKTEEELNNIAIDNALNIVKARFPFGELASPEFSTALAAEIETQKKLLRGSVKTDKSKIIDLDE